MIKYFKDNDVIVTVCSKGTITFTRLHSMKFIMTMNLNEHIVDMTYCEDNIIILTENKLYAYTQRGDLLTEIEKTGDYVAPLFNTNLIALISDKCISFTVAHNLESSIFHSNYLFKDQKISHMYEEENRFWIFTEIGNVIRVTREKPIPL